MKILIITYSREVNPGTFLQAYGVQYALKKLYPDAKIDLLKHRRMYYSITSEKKMIVGKKAQLAFMKAKLSAIPRRLKYEMAYRTKFSLTHKEFDFFDYDEDEFKLFAEKYDLIVVGSDTILINVEKNGRYGLMWLMGINANKIMFAASAAPANFKLSERQRYDLYTSLSTFKLLGVRDGITKKLVDEIGLNDKVYIQYDPTYLIPKNKFVLPLYIKRILEQKHKYHRIALINFGKGFNGTKMITENLKQKGYFTIATLYNQWADANFMTLSPFEWGALFRYIDLTISDSFHNCVFTFMNNKPAIAVDWKNTRFSVDGFSKTKDLMHIYNLDEFHYLYNIEDGVKPILDIICLAENSFDSEKTIAVNNFIAEDYRYLMKKIGATVKSV